MDNQFKQSLPSMNHFHGMKAEKHSQFTHNSVHSSHTTSQLGNDAHLSLHSMHYLPPKCPPFNSLLATISETIPSFTSGIRAVSAATAASSSSHLRYNPLPPPLDKRINCSQHSYEFYDRFCLPQSMPTAAKHRATHNISQQPPPLPPIPTQQQQQQQQGQNSLSNQQICKQFPRFNEETNLNVSLLFLLLFLRLY
ncbi:unnamed protein product [Trichobilharzia regenti]|nr:unnamed protein product [Trichobilharzia regenti]